MGDKFDDDIGAVQLLCGFVYHEGVRLGVISIVRLCTMIRGWILMNIGNGDNLNE